MSRDHEHHDYAAPALPGSPPVIRRLVLSVALTGVVLAAEIAGGIWAHSLALLSDAAHVFMDLFALALSLAALLLARLPADDKRTFGWHRAEVFAALVNGLSLIGVAVIIFVEAAKRLAHPEPVKGVGLLAIAAAGLVANAAIALILRRHVGGDLNLRAAFLHVIGDAAASVGVIIGAVVVIFTGWYLIDPLLAIAIGGLLLWGAGRLVHDATHILLEGTPPGIRPRQVAAALETVEGVAAVHDLHVWAICSHIKNLSAHLVVREGAADAVRVAAEKVLADGFGIRHTTLQMEEESCNNSGTVFCEKLAH